MADFFSSLTSEMTSSSFSAEPAMMPAATAASMPFRCPVLGTITLFTFLMMLPLTCSCTLSGSTPSTSRAFAAA